MADIIHRVGIRASAQQVDKALSTTAGIAGWWTAQTSGSSEIGGSIFLRFLSMDGKELGSMRMEVKALEPGKKIQWICREGPVEWMDTTIQFDLQEEGDYTIVLFGHRNWKEQVEFTAHCSMKWAVFLLSLKEFVESGKGRPSPHDIKIDNWN